MNKEELISVASDVVCDLESAASGIQDAIWDLESIEYEIDTVEEDDDDFSEEIADSQRAANTLDSVASGLGNVVSSVENAITALCTAEQSFLPLDSANIGIFHGRLINPAARHALNASLRICEMEIRLGEYESALKTLERAEISFKHVVEEMRSVVSSGMAE